MEPQSPSCIEACRLFALGYKPRQIARKVGVLPSIIRARALAENWVAAPVPGWSELRLRYEQGEELATIARTCPVSHSTLRKRRSRENWSRTISGLGALRHSVMALQLALTKVPLDDPGLIARIGTALSMAAGRLSKAEGDNKRHAGLSGDDEATEEGATGTEMDILELSRLMEPQPDDVTG